MAEWGEFAVDAAVDGGVLWLRGGPEASDRVYLGPLRHGPDENRRCGLVQTRTSGTATASLYGTPETTGQLGLYGRMVGPGGLKPFAAVWAGCEGKRAISELWGYLRLQTVSSDRHQLGYTVRLESEDRRGSVEVYDAFSPASFAVLRVDEQGPFLYMTNGARSITISPDGISQSPDKGPAPDLVAALPDLGAGLDVGQGPRDPRLPAQADPNLPAPGLEVAFVADHPTDPSLQIHYNVLEGPEVGVYVRGRARLQAGRTVVRLPDHFRHIAASSDLTVQLTPRSAESRGLAATRLTVEDLEITELADGKGDYDVDYAVHGVRKGREGYEVLRPRSRVPAPRVRARGPSADDAEGA